MPSIPFSVYDFFGYIASGLLLCFAADYVLPGDWIIEDTLPPSVIAFWTVAAYIVGQANAQLSGFLLEQQFTWRVLGKTIDNLMGGQQHDWRATLFPTYFRPLPEDVKERIRDRALGVGNLIGDSLFHHVRTIAKRDKETWANLNCFIERYGFCRNMSLALLISAILVSCRGEWLLFIVAMFGAILMFYRFLKFYRQYTFEALTAYPDIPEAKEK